QSRWGLLRTPSSNGSFVFSVCDADLPRRPCLRHQPKGSIKDIVEAAGGFTMSDAELKARAGGRVTLHEMTAVAPPPSSRRARHACATLLLVTRVPVIERVFAHGTPAAVGLMAANTNHSSNQHVVSARTADGSTPQVYRVNTGGAGPPGDKPPFPQTHFGADNE